MEQESSISLIYSPSAVLHLYNNVNLFYPVWALKSWNNPDLGPASAIQLLDEKGKAELGELQR